MVILIIFLVVFTLPTLYAIGVCLDRNIIFLALCSWWWPWKQASAHTIAASLLDDDERCEQFARRTDTRNGEYEHEAGLGFNCFGKLYFDGKYVDGDIWGRFVWEEALRAWRKRRRQIDRDNVDYATAQAVKESVA